MWRAGCPEVGRRAHQHVAGKLIVQTVYLWRGSLLPLGCEAAPCIRSDIPRWQDLRLLRSRAGASSLATRDSGLSLGLRQLLPQRRSASGFGDGFQTRNVLGQIFFTCTDDPDRLTIGRQTTDFRGGVVRALT